MSSNNIVLLAGCALLGPGFIVYGCMGTRSRTWIKTAAKVEKAEIEWEGDGHVLNIEYSFSAQEPGSYPGVQKKYIRREAAPGGTPWTVRGRQKRLTSLQRKPMIEVWYPVDNPSDCSLKLQSNWNSFVHGSGCILVGIAIILFGILVFFT